MNHKRKKSETDLWQNISAYLLKTTTKKTKQQATDLKKIFDKYISDKYLFIEFVKIFYHSNIRRKPNF
jgi:hypothetical protein